MNKTLKEWYEDNPPETSGIMKVVSQSFDNEPAVQQIPPEETDEEPETTEEITDIIKPLFTASMIKVTLEELLKLSNANLTKEHKDDILTKIDKLKEEVSKL